MDFRLVPNQSENGEYNPIPVDLTRFRKDFPFCVMNFVGSDASNCISVSCPSDSYSIVFYYPAKNRGNEFECVQHVEPPCEPPYMIRTF